jgi:hypothetical protein
LAGNLSSWGWWLHAKSAQWEARRTSAYDRRSSPSASDRVERRSKREEAREKQQERRSKREEAREKKQERGSKREEAREKKQERSSKREEARERSEVPDCFAS